MDVAAFLHTIRQHPRFAGQLVHVEDLPARPGRFAEPCQPLPDRLRGLLTGGGIERLYVHQVAAMDAAQAGRDVVVVTGTASGKTLCYHLPILRRALEQPASRALCLFPTKALAQDQLRGLLELVAADPDIQARLTPGVYDGDTPPAQRRRIKAEANVILSNPDMLHASILPHHAKWHRFFSHLDFVVLDEVHTYRGILGAHVACVLRRLLRVCAHYGARPVFLCTSATIANPGELVSRLLGRPVQVIDQDGSPRGRKYFALWNPLPHERDRLQRGHATDDAAWLMVAAMQCDAQTLAFTRTRQAAELVNRYVQDHLASQRSPLVDKVRAYRGGYLPDERRQIEQELFRGELRGVAATNALELGLDIGSLDVALLVNYPGTIASTWQQAGRSGRRHAESLAILLAGNDPVDQYLLRHPEYFFAQSPECAVVDPHNPYVLARHLKAAAFELPLVDDELEHFGGAAGKILQILCDSQELSRIDGRAYYRGEHHPAHRISLRHMSDETYSIVLCQETAAALPARGGHVHGQRGRRPGRERPGPGQPDLGTGRHDLSQRYQVIANVDAISAPELVYPGAVYLHHGETYFIRQLDLDGRVAYATRQEMDYYTQAVLESHVQLVRQQQADTSETGLLAFGDVDVTWQTVMFKKIKFHTRENIGFGQVDLPAQSLQTTALWFAPAAAIRAAIRRAGRRTSEGLCGLRNLSVQALPVIAMCDSRDIGGVVESQNLGCSALVLYDRYPGGLGYCEKGHARFIRLLELCHEMVSECPCGDGCPSCVGLPHLRPAIHSDPDLTRGFPMPDKSATELLLRLLLSPVALADRDEVTGPPRPGPAGALSAEVRD
jgi:DEAD/DEAH box helicase domain-containing protein